MKDIKKEALEHALHNEKVCRYLDKKESFSDWIITTAFYSALHFVKFKIFPLKYKTSNGKEIEITDMEMYSRVTGIRNLSKHQMLADLVSQHLPDISPEYNSLKDMSWTARYAKYQYGRDISNKAKKDLEKIKVKCAPKK